MPGYAVEDALVVGLSEIDHMLVLANYLKYSSVAIPRA